MRLITLQYYSGFCHIASTFDHHSLLPGASLEAQRINRLPAMQETRVRSLGWEDPLEKEMATHSSILAWRIPWLEEPSGLQSTGSQRVGHDWATSLSCLRSILICLYSPSQEQWDFYCTNDEICFTFISLQGPSILRAPVDPT